MKNRISLVFRSLAFALFFLVINAYDIMAQCAMCRASVESNVNEDGIGFAAKLNTGILYLFVMPYLIAIVIGLLWYKNSRENRRKQEEALQIRQRIAGL